MKFNRALEFAKSQYRKNMDITDDTFIDELTGVADILEEMGYSTEYLITAIFRNLLRDTSADPFEMLNFCTMEMLEAVQILTKPNNCAMLKHFDDVKGNMLAFPVKMAEHLYELRKARGNSPAAVKELLRKSDEYYKKCAVDTRFYEPIFQASMALEE